MCTKIFTLIRSPQEKTRGSHCVLCCIPLVISYTVHFYVWSCYERVYCGSYCIHTVWLMKHQYDHLLKLLLVGDSGVGKTSILLCFTSEEFKDDQKSTIGVDLKLKMMDLRGKRLKLTVWDTAGQ